MTSVAVLKFSPLVAALIVAAGTDLYQRRIPNWLTFPLCAAGLLQSFTAMRTVTPLDATAGMLVGFSLTFVLFAIGADGGGDVKLHAALGAWLGAGPTLAVFMAGKVIGMLIVVGQALWQGRLGKLLENSALLTINLVHLREVGVEHAQATGRSCRSIEKPLPCAVPVLLAVLLILARS
jgi:prepilin peptidase CpaA